MIFNTNNIRNSARQYIAVLVISILAFALFTAEVRASEVSVQLHSGTEENGVGYSFSFSNNISTNKNWRWGIGYSNLDELKAKWNGQETSFDNSNADIFIAYRHFPRSYNQFLRPFNFEVQAGTSFSLTENKFTFDQFPDQEVVFSEKGDVNFYVSFAAQYQVSKEAQLQLGYKFYPEYSEFDDQGSIFFGISYQFGRKLNY